MPKLRVCHSTTPPIQCALRLSPRSSRPTRSSHRHRPRTYVSNASQNLAQWRIGPHEELWFTPSSPQLFSPTGAGAFDSPNGDANGGHRPPDERIIKLGKTLRILSPLLPTMLVNPLPPEILSPHVTLHLFPSTHPHLPTVRGRVLYRAALWTVPVAWSSVPLVGNVKLQILSERMVRAGTVIDSRPSGEQDCGDERLVVRWRTEARNEHNESVNSVHQSSRQAASTDGTNKGLSVLLGGEAPIFKLSKEEQFTGLFIFSFDEEGRISSHTIEHADDADGWDRTAKFVTLTDWLLGKARGSMDPSAGPGLAIHGCNSLDSLRSGRTHA
ncbi:hypothetical protein DTO207G8_8633 [Paecilomyces variotii]|nr:hypothetical protein DTO207G8_8633 [Paecilomyces variotii]KAJ9382346.1 hypothetical protein DTO063F5_5730 [Paecilomyces variotii]